MPRAPEHWSAPSCGCICHSGIPGITMHHQRPCCAQAAIVRPPESDPPEGSLPFRGLDADAARAELVPVPSPTSHGD
ncbi:MAG: hypothetical protein HYY50_00770 [Candidatus Kerfeldbacteria bacterium]|nr:hypothetical protein [Candidatus Kerfeldbacteria bacterium]